MRESILETRGTYKAHRWGVVFVSPLGYRCGYVEVPEALNKLKSELEDLDVHGGVTYIDHFNPIDLAPTKSWWIGFDCAHVGDGFTSRFFTLRDPSEEVRSQEYCVKECERLIDQLIELEEHVAKGD